MRLCTDPSTFIQSHGIECYKKSFRITDSIDTLLNDPVLSQANDIYEEENGVSIKDLLDFIHKWGLDTYKEWCHMSNEYPFHRKRFDAYHRPIPEPHPPIYAVDENGWPDPIGPVLEIDDKSAAFIKKNGIIFYMIRFKNDLTLTELLSYKNIAALQRSYIRDLEESDRIL